jgi:hypothetical protein
MAFNTYGAKPTGIAGAKRHWRVRVAIDDDGKTTFAPIQSDNRQAFGIGRAQYAPTAQRDT